MMGPLRPTAMRAWISRCVLCCFLAGVAATAHAGVLKVGDRLAELDVATDAAGKPFKLKSLAGKWVVVTIGASWCKPCAKELPTWDRIAGELKGKVVFVALDIDDEIEAGKKFHDKLKLKNIVRVYLPADKSGVAASYGGENMPSTFVADGQGIVRMVHAGFEDGDDKKLKDALTKLVK